MEKLLKLKAELEKLESSIDEGEFVPGKEGCKQKSPNQIRSEIRNFMAENGMNQTRFLEKIGVNANSFNKFMNGVYKDQWSACQNGTYWAAAKFMACHKLQQKIAELEAPKAPKVSSAAVSAPAVSASASSGSSSMASWLGKRPAEANDQTNDAIIGMQENQPPKKKSKEEIQQQIKAILAIDVPADGPIYHNCDEIRKMIDSFLITSGINQTSWLTAIGVQSNSLAKFRAMKGKGAGAANMVYPRAYRFFEQKRILDGKPKSAKRLEQEQRWGLDGFPLQHDDGKRWSFSGQPTDKKMFDIEYCRDRQNERIASGEVCFVDQYILEKQRKDREKKLGVVSSSSHSSTGGEAHVLEI